MSGSRNNICYENVFDSVDVVEGQFVVTIILYAFFSTLQILVISSGEGGKPYIALSLVCKIFFYIVHLVSEELTASEYTRCCCHLFFSVF